MPETSQLQKYSYCGSSGLRGVWRRKPTWPGPPTQPLRPRFRPQINTYNSPTLKGLGEGQ